MYQGLRLSTDYSGLGAAEEALNQLLAASRSMAAAQGLPLDATFQCQRAGDQATHCRKVLMCHTGPFRPCCIHNNSMDRCPEKFKTRMEAEREQGLKKAQHGSEQCQSCLWFARPRSFAEHRAVHAVRWRAGAGGCQLEGVLLHSSQAVPSDSACSTWIPGLEHSLRRCVLL